MNAEQDRFPNFDFQEFLTERNIAHRLQDADDHQEIRFNCPSCLENGEDRADTKMRLWVAPTKGKFHCFNCGWDGNLIRLVMTMAKVGVRGALRLMHGKTSPFEHLSYPLIHDDERLEEDDIEVPEVEFPHGFETFEDARRKTIFHDYLKARGIPLSYAKLMGWGFSTVGYVKNRLIVPTYMNDRLVFWQARDVLGDGSLTGKRHEHWKTADYKKVLNPKGTSSRKVIYGYDTLKSHEEIVLVEGFTDAAKVGPMAAAINGKTLHAAQVEALAALPRLKSVVLLLDPDAWEDARYHRNGPRRGKLKKPCSVEVAKSLLQIYTEVRAVRLPEGRDAGSYEVGALDSLIWPKGRRQGADRRLRAET